MRKIDREIHYSEPTQAFPKIFVFSFEKEEKKRMGEKIKEERNEKKEEGIRKRPEWKVKQGRER